MAVAHDAASESTVSISEASFSWTHTPIGTPRGAIVYVLTISGTALDTAVTYGGVSMELVGSGSDTDTEPGTVRCYYLDNVSSGAQSVVVTRTNNATQMMGMAATVTAGAATEAYTSGMVTQGGSTENTGSDSSGTGTGSSTPVAVNDGSPGTDSVRYCAFFCGAATPYTPDAATSTLLNNHDFSSFGWVMARETTAGQGSRTVGMTTGNTDDRAAVYVAVRETPAPPSIECAASVTGTASVAAALSTSIRAAASVSGTATTTAALSTAITFATSVSGTATTTAGLDTAIPLAAAVTGTATVAGDFSTAITLAGTLIGTATVSGALDTAITFASSVTGVATVAADLLTIQIPTYDTIRVAAVRSSRSGVSAVRSGGAGVSAARTAYD